MSIAINELFLVTNAVTGWKESKSTWLKLSGHGL